VKKTYGNAVSILLTDTLSFSLALLKGVLVLELGTHLMMLMRSYQDAGEAGPMVMIWAVNACRGF